MVKPGIEYSCLLVCDILNITYEMNETNTI